jgi:hypothetical protein
MQRVFLWSMLLFPLLIAGYVFELIGILSCNDNCFLSFSSSFWSGISFFPLPSNFYNVYQAFLSVNLSIH